MLLYILKQYCVHFSIAYTYTPPCHIKTFNYYIHTLGRRQSKTPKLSRNVDQKWLETEFLIAICRHTGDKWQSKTLFLSIFDPCSSIVDNIFDCRLPGVIHSIDKIIATSLNKI